MFKNFMLLGPRLGRSWLIFVILSVTLCTSSYAGQTSRDHLLVYGDSLSAAYGMDLEQGWVHLLADEIEDRLSVTNASISGETTIGGLNRLASTLKELTPTVVLLELGANDGLRGYSIASMKANLAEMIDSIKLSGAKPILAGISLPASYGPRYIDSFRKMYRDLADQHGIAYVDFYNEEFLTNPDYLQADGLHPTVLSQSIIKESMKNFLIAQKIIN